MLDLLRLPVDGIKIERPFAERLGSPVADAVAAPSADSVRSSASR